jgi:diguanylate cyclase (GGDEF)-like protein/PAS domain S-box-containing protein
MEAEAQRQMTALIYRNAGLAFAVNAVCAFLVAYVNAALRAPAAPAFFWWCLVFALAAARYLLSRSYQGAYPDTTAATLWRRRYVAATAAIAAVWGLGGDLFIWNAPDELRLFTGLVMVGMVAGAVPILAPVPTAFRVFALLVCVPMSAIILLQANSALLWAFGSMTLIFLAAVLVSANYWHETLDALIRTNLEKGRLLDDLRQSEARVREIVDHSPIGMGIVAPDGRFIRVNHALCAMLGFTSEEFERLTTSDITHPDDRAAFADEFQQLLSAKIVRIQLEKRFLRKDGTAVWAQITASLLRVSENASPCVLGQIEDITERRMWREQMYHHAYYDPLTDLPNRRLLLDLVNQALAEASRRGRAVAILYVDVDRFKEINDSLGHDAGDRLLKEVAERLKASVRRGDIVSRQGGDEFVIVLTDLEHAPDATAVSLKILEAFARPIQIAENEVNATISIGISLFPNDATQDVDELINKSDAAMYAAKLHGRNCYRYYHEAAGSLGNLTILRRGNRPQVSRTPTASS